MPWPSGYPKTLTPEQRVERARHAARFRASADGLIAALARKPLTAEQQQRLAELVSAARQAEATEEVEPS